MQTILSLLNNLSALLNSCVNVICSSCEMENHREKNKNHRLMNSRDSNVKRQIILTMVDDSNDALMLWSLRLKDLGKIFES